MNKIGIPLAALVLATSLGLATGARESSPAAPSGGLAEPGAQATAGEVAILGPRFRVGGVLYFGPETRFETGAPALSFVRDVEPPTLAWETGGLELIERWGAPEAAKKKTLRRPKRLWHKGRRDDEVILLWSSDGRKWVPIPWSPEEPQWSLDFARPHLFLQTGERDVVLRGGPERLGGDQVLRIWADDDGCGVLSLTLEAEWAHDAAGTSAGERLLRLHTEDCVGNGSTVEWWVEPQSARG